MTVSPPCHDEVVVDTVPELLDLGGLSLSDSDSEPKDPKKKGDGLTRRERNEQFRLNKRRKEAYDTFVRVEGLKSASEVFDKLPRKTMCIVNVGFGAVGGASAEELEEIFGVFDGFERIVMRHGKPYSFVTFRSSDQAEVAHSAMHEKPCKQLNNKHIFLEYLTHLKFAYLSDRLSGPGNEDERLGEDRGLYYVPDFITEEEERTIMENIKRDEDAEQAIRGGNDDRWFKIQERYVKHYGHSFDYHIKHVGTAEMTASTELPPWIFPFIDRIKERIPIYNEKPNQLTIQRYPPGSGISFHTDSHTSFMDTIVILSMGTPVQMDFRKPASKALVTVDLVPRSLVMMSGEARYGWEHAIRLRHSDLIDGKVRERQERWSITMRTINEDMVCKCKYLALCDNNAQLVQQLRSERNHVHE